MTPRSNWVIVFVGTLKLKLSQFFARAERKHLKRKAAAPAKFKKKTS